MQYIPDFWKAVIGQELCRKEPYSAGFRRADEAWCIVVVEFGVGHTQACGHISLSDI